MSKAQSMNSFTEENYLKAIYKLQEQFKGSVNTNAIAEKLTTKPASVTDMLKKLSEKKLINYVKYQGVSLTEEGEKIAVSIVRKHRLWEYFLVKKLNFGWDEVHDLAEELEHINSDELVERLDKFLDYPAYDPHGDPIPNRSGQFNEHHFILMQDMQEGAGGKIAGVKDHSPVFLQYLERLKLVLGKELEIVERNSFDGSLIIRLNKQESLLVSKEVAANIFIAQ